MDSANQSIAVSRAPIAPPRHKKRLKQLSLEQVKSHSEPNSPVLPMKKPSPPRPPPCPNMKLDRARSTEQDKNNGLQAHHPRVEKRVSAPPLRPPPPVKIINDNTVIIISKNSQEGRKIPPMMPPPPKSIPPRPRSSFAMAPTDKSINAKSSPPRSRSSLANPVADQNKARAGLSASADHHFHTGPRSHKKKKGMERKTSSPDCKIVKNESKRESLYLNVAPRLPANVRKKNVELSEAYSQNPRYIKPPSNGAHKSTENKKQQNHKSTQQTSSTSSPRTKLPAKNTKIQQGKLGPLPRLPPPEKVVPYSLYTEILDNDNASGGDDDYSYVHLKPRFDLVGASRHLESLDLELSRYNDTDAYVNNDYNGPCPRLPTSQSAEYMPLLTKNRIDDDIYADPQHDVSEDQKSINNDYNGPHPRLHTSQNAEYMPLLTKNRIDDDIYADPQHDVSDDDDSPVEAYAVVNVHTINQESSGYVESEDCYMSLSNQTLENYSDYQQVSLIPQT